MSLPPARLTSLGAGGAVTGSRHLLGVGGQRCLVERGPFHRAHPGLMINDDASDSGTAFKKADLHGD